MTEENFDGKECSKMDSNKNKKEINCVNFDDFQIEKTIIANKLKSKINQEGKCFCLLKIYRIYNYIY